MWLTYEEYQEFKTRFHCTAWPDEDNRVPVDVVETPDGIPPWTTYISGSCLREAVEWIKGRRNRSTAESAAARDNIAAMPGQEARATTPWHRPDHALSGAETKAAA